MLALARGAGERGGTYPCAFNAANEVAVARFLDGRIGFLEIAELVEEVLGRVDGSAAHSLDELYEADRQARELALEVASRRRLDGAARGAGAPVLPAQEQKWA